MERYASSVPWANTMTLRQKFVRPARHVQLASVRVVTEVALARAKLARLESFRRNLSATIVQQIPILVIKSERDAVAKFDASIHQTDNIMVLDVTNPKETDLFREHLFHMAHPIKATKIISDFVDKIEKNRLLKVNNSH